MRFLLALMGATLLGLAADPALAAQVLPHGGNAWDLHVFGNGRVIADLLMSLKMLMAPDHGDSGFQMVLLFMATVGFISVAVAAGFNPAQNLMKLFTYIMVVWAVTFSTTKLTANITVNDPVNNYYYTVERVPALVGVPAAIISQVGIYLTRTIETYFSIPGEFKVAGPNGTGGYYNLFNRMMSETDQFVIKNPNLKKSVSAFMGDCVVPAIAQGRLQVAVQEGGVSRTAYGNEALMRSTNLMETLKNARHKAIQTRYYLPETTPQALAELGRYVQTDEINTGMGVVVSCDDAYALLEKDLASGANELLTANASAWGKTGAMVSYETAMSVALAQASSGGQNPWSNGTRPSGYILQASMISTMSGAFRDVAAQVGNNEFINAAAITQAEHNQKSTWSAGAQVFNNMMGYVYTVLQAFIFAIVPIVVIALMVPGLGSAIFKNYGQILVWLTMWMPMLAIINYLITLFGIEQVQGVTALDTGLSFSNRYLVTEKTNDLMIAAQFLGTMVPLLAWGLVRGSMAFTEFISHGIGSGFAAQAGATSASGNLSLNNMSMDNTSMNKFNTAQSSAVGQQAVLAHANAGALDVANQLGGTSAQANASSLSTTQSAGYSRASALSHGQSSSDGTTATQGRTVSEGRSLGHSESAGTQSQLGEQRAVSASSSMSANTGVDAKRSTSVDDRDAVTGDNQVATSKDAGIKMNGGAGLSPGGGGGGGGGGGAGGLVGGAGGAGGGGRGGVSVKPGAGFDGHAGFSSSERSGLTHQNSRSAAESASAGVSSSMSQGASRGVSDSHTAGLSQSRSSGDSASQSLSVQASEGVQRARSSSESYSHNNTWQSQTGMQTNFTRSFDMSQVDSLIASTESAMDMWEAGARMTRMSEGVNHAAGGAASAFEAAGATVEAGVRGMPGHFGPGNAGPGPSMGAFGTAASNIAAWGGTTSAQHSALAGAVSGVLAGAGSRLDNPLAMSHLKQGTNGFELGSGIAPAQKWAGGAAAAGWTMGLVSNVLDAAPAAGAAAGGAAGARAALGLASRTFAVGAAGWAGYEVGERVVNPAVNRGVEWLTNGRESSLGGWAYSIRHGE